MKNPEWHSLDYLHTMKNHNNIDTKKNGLAFLFS